MSNHQNRTTAPRVDKPAKTKIKVSKTLELSRSPVDGMWRAWVPVGFMFRPVDDGPTVAEELSCAWGIVASAPKAAAAIEAARGLGFH